MWASQSGKSDANAMRIAELYARALDQLGDPRPPMRVGGLHALEAVGQERPERRPAIVDVICAYLRMPMREDGPVRLAAQRILSSHLRPGPAFWAGTHLDLSGAVLHDVDLTGCRVDGDLRLDQVRFVGPARLRGLVVGGRTSLQGAKFDEHAWLERAIFRGPLYAQACTFHGDAWFGEGTFGGPTSFAAANFVGHAWFGGCRFAAPVDFADAVFRRSAGFRGADAPEVRLTGTTFVGAARVSRRGNSWSVTAPGWVTVVDPDNESVGQLLWAGHARLVGAESDEEKTPV